MDKLKHRRGYGKQKLTKIKTALKECGNVEECEDLGLKSTLECKMELLVSANASFKEAQELIYASLDFNDEDQVADFDQNTEEFEDRF